MKIRKIISSALIVTMIFALAIGTFAEGRTLNGGEYIAGTVKHRFNTNATSTKTSSQSWGIVTENSSYSKYYKEGDSDNATAGSHLTYLVDANGSRLTSNGKTIESGESISFTTTDMDRNSSSNSIKLQIHNTRYSDTKEILKARGLLTSTAR